MTTHLRFNSGERAATRRPTDRAQRDRGFTFIEIVVTVVLMTIVLVPILAAVHASIEASTRSRHAAQVETVILNVADRINRAPKKCDYTVNARGAVTSNGWYALPSEYEQAAQVTHEWYDIAIDDWVSKDELDPTFATAPGCPGSGLVQDDLLVQRVTVTVAHPDGDVRRTIVVVKSDV